MADSKEDGEGVHCFLLLHHGWREQLSDQEQAEEDYNLVEEHISTTLVAVFRRGILIRHIPFFFFFFFLSFFYIVFFLFLFFLWLRDTIYLA